MPESGKDRVAAIGNAWQKTVEHAKRTAAELAKEKAPTGADDKEGGTQ